MGTEGAELELGTGTKCANLEKRSMIVNIMVLPLEGGSPVTKSMDRWDQGHEGM